MTAILLAHGANKRRVGRFTEIEVRNLIAETSAADPSGGLSLLNRPAIVALATAGAGPNRGLFQKAGLFGGDALVPSGDELYRVSASGVSTLLTGTVLGEGRVSMDGARNVSTTPPSDEVRIATGATGLLLVTGTTVTPEALPDDAPCSDIAAIRNVWIAIRQDTQQAYQKLDSDVAWTALSSTSAEKEPDNLVAVEVLGDTIWFFGTDSLEGWSLTGTADPLIAPIPGASFNTGCLARDSIVRIGESLFFVGADYIVYELTTFPKPISDNAFAEQARNVAATSIRAGGFGTDGHAFLVIRLGGDSTQVYDLSCRLWIPWNSLGLDVWRPHLVTQIAGSQALAVDDGSGMVWRVDPEALTDDGDEIDRVFTGIFPLRAGMVHCDAVRLYCAVGLGLQDGQGSDPQIGMQYSDDQGQTYTEWEFVSLGEAGQYATEVTWRRLGQIEAPGRIFKWKVTDPITVRVDGAEMNPDQG
jgi:hypothetical protein